MALLNIEMVQQKVKTFLKNMKPPRGVEILSYKRNRGITLLLMPNSQIQVRERGYYNQEIMVSIKDLPKLLKGMMKREFPRSRKVRLYQLSGPDEVGQPRKKL